MINVEAHSLKMRKIILFTLEIVFQISTTNKMYKNINLPHLLYMKSSDWGIEISEDMNQTTCAESKKKLIALCEITDSYLEKSLVRIEK